MTRCYVVTNDGAVHGFSFQNGQPLWPPNQQPGGIIPASLSPDGTRLTAGHRDGHVRFYETATGKLLLDQSAGLGEIRTLRFAPDGSGRFLSGGAAGAIHLWNVHTGEKLQTFPGHTGIVLAVAWSRDSLTFASDADDCTVRLRNPATGQPAAPAMPHLAVPNHLEFSPDGTRLATCSRDGTARLWEPGTGQPVCPPLRQGQACTTVRFTDDGAVFFVHDHDGFRFWDTATALPVTLHYQEPVSGGFAFDSDAGHPFISPEGTRVYLSYARNDGAAWSIPQPRGPVPAWFPDFLEMPAQLQIDPTAPSGSSPTPPPPPSQQPSTPSLRTSLTRYGRGGFWAESNSRAATKDKSLLRRVPSLPTAPASPTIPLTESDGPMKALLWKLSLQAQLWILNSNEVARFDGIAIADCGPPRNRSARFPEIMLAALQLLKATDPCRYARVRRRLAWITRETLAIFGSAEYQHATRRCCIDFLELSTEYDMELSVG